MIERLPDGEIKVRCACGADDCTASARLVTFPDQNTAVISLHDDADDEDVFTEISVRLSDLQAALEQR
jgi:hypothetical protein